MKFYIIIYNTSIDSDSKIRNSNLENDEYLNKSQKKVPKLKISALILEKQNYI